MNMKRKLLVVTIVISILLPQNLISLTAENFASRLKQANLARKSDIANLVNKTDFDDKLLIFNR